MMHRHLLAPAPLTPMLQVVAAFLLGGAATWLVYRALASRHEPGPISDDIVQRHVRARVGELVERPEDVTVHVENGNVRVAGRVDRAERDALLASLLEAPGVVRLRSALSIR